MNDEQMARYRAAEPKEVKPQMMICERAGACLDRYGKCKFRSPHICESACQDHPWCNGTEVHCIPSPEAAIEPQMMQACATARQCTLSHCFHRDEHQGGDGCLFSYSRCPPCVPVPEPVSAPKSEPAPVREIDRAELQRRIDVVRPYLFGMEREERDKPLHPLPAYGVGLLADLEALADGNARIEAVAGQKAWCPFARRTCLEWACGLCPEAVEWASEWARDCGWKEPR